MFEQAGDRLLLAATLADSAGLYFEDDPEDSAWALANVAKACDILSEMDSPNWYGHALYYHGILLRFEEETEEAAHRLERGLRLLDDVGDSNCWAGATRQLVACDLASGNVGRAADRLEAVMERMPVLPMQEVHMPATLDSMAETLLVAGRLADGGRLLGRSLATPSQPEAAIRPAHLERLRTRAIDLLGEEHARRLFEEGQSLELNEALAKGRALLAELVE